jgi:hypothetical protein
LAAGIVAVRIQSKPLSPKLLSQNAILFLDVFNRVLLLFIQSPG